MIVLLQKSFPSSPFYFPYTRIYAKLTKIIVIGKYLKSDECVENQVSGISDTVSRDIIKKSIIVLSDC
jgi:hypothetical protein